MEVLYPHEAFGHGASGVHYLCSGSPIRFLVREGEIHRDPTSASRTPEGGRDKALILTLFDTGLREGELVSMGWQDA